MTASFSARTPLSLRLLAGAYLVLVALAIAAALYTLAVSVWRGPWRDTWEAMPFIQRALEGQAGWADYWEQYGYSHRPVLSRWLWVADLRWFAGSNALLLGVSVAMQCLVFGAILGLLRREQRFSTWEKRVVLAGVLFCLFNITQVFNFLHTFDVQWFLVTGFGVLAIERLLTAGSVPSAWRLVWVWLCVLVASLNNFSALLFWPVLVLLLLALRFPARQVLVFVVATGIYLACYFHGLPTGGGSLVSTLAGMGWLQRIDAAIGLLLVFPLYYLSNPLSFQLSADGPQQYAGLITWLAPALAGLLLCGAIRSAWQGVMGTRALNPVAWMGVSLMLYGYGVGVVTALGRAVFWENVYALRYQNIVLLFWIGVVLWLAAGWRSQRGGIVLGACLLLGVFGYRVDWYHDLMLKTGNRTRDAHLALAVGLERHLSAIQATVSRSHLGQGNPYHLEREAAVLRTLPAGPYADPAWQVPPHAELRGAATCDLPALVVDVRGHPDRYARLAADFAEPVSVDLIAWFDGDDPLPGLLVGVRADTFIARLIQTRDGFSQFAGFARTLPEQAPTQLFARSGNTWCRLAVP